MSEIQDEYRMYQIRSVNHDSTLSVIQHRVIVDNMDDIGYKLDERKNSHE